MWSDKVFQIHPLNQRDPITICNYKGFLDHAVNVLFRFIKCERYDRLVDRLYLKPVKGADFVMITLVLYDDLTSSRIDIDLARVTGTLDDFKDFGIPTHHAFVDPLNQ